MLKITRLIIVLALCFTLLVAWFGWAAFDAAPLIAAENLRGAGLSISAAIEQVIAADPSFQSLAHYASPDIAYFALIDQQGAFRFHTNPGLIGQPASDKGRATLSNGIAEQRVQLGTGEEAYLLRTRIHPDGEEFDLELVLHTFRADNVIRRTTAGATIVLGLLAALWVMTVALIYLLRKEERHQQEMHRREELARLGEMGAVLAHEIRNPLAGIKGFAQLVETASTPEQARSYAGRIVSQSLRMEGLVNDLLLFARADQGEKRITDLAVVAEECVALLRNEATEQRVTIELATEGKIEAPVVPDRIVQMLLNLMKNAMQAMPDGGAMKIDLRRDKKAVRMIVSDNGAGIPPEHLAHIFEPFWTSKTTGTGLGLALCKKIVEEHGGTLRVESSVGSGTACTAILPANR